MTQDKVICIFGGAGFLGRHITQELARAGYRIKIATRIPESAYELKTYGNVGQVVPFKCNYNDPKAITEAVKGCDAVINLIGILFEKRKSKFKKIHVELPQQIAKACAKQDVKKLIHVSALGIEQSKSKYGKSKLEGEKAVLKAFPQASILRPSVVFGAGDSFFNMFAKMAIFLPVLPLIGGGQTKFQPVFVGDIAEAVANIIIESKDQYEGKTYQLGGPEVVTFKQIYQILLEEINRTNRLVSVPWWVAKVQGFIFGFMPKPLLTIDQVRSLRTDNVVEQDALGFKELDVQPTAMGTILPRYLSCYRRGGRFADKKIA